jgi:hypothetical protein
LPGPFYEATSIWNWIIANKPDLGSFIVSSVLDNWDWTLKHRKGFFSKAAG